MSKPYYEHGGITIWHGDWRECVLRSADLLLTDPPYGIGEAAGSNKSRSKLATAKDFGNLGWDNTPPSDADLNWVRSFAKHQIIFGGNYFSLPPSSCWLVWDKDNGANDFGDCELAWTNLSKAVRRFKWRWQGMLQEEMANKEYRCHPTQKPLAVMKWALSQAPQGVRTVLDPYMGSGTTLMACKAAGLECVGCEREEDYCESAAIRLSQEVFDFAGAL